MVMTLLLIMIERSGLCHFKAHDLIFPNSGGKAIYDARCMFFVQCRFWCSERAIFESLNSRYFNGTH